MTLWKQTHVLERYKHFFVNYQTIKYQRQIRPLLSSTKLDDLINKVTCGV